MTDRITFQKEAEPYRLSDWRTVIRILCHGGVGVIPTDTIYGLVGSALLPKTVERIYRLRCRNQSKPMIVLIGSLADLKRFGVTLDTPARKTLRTLWPGKVSVVLPVTSPRFKYLHRGTKTIAFRLPAWPPLRHLLRATGPLVAPSVNREGKPPAENISEARRYFGERVDFYVNSGHRQGRPSTLVSFRNNHLTVLRPGAAKVEQVSRPDLEH